MKKYISGFLLSIFLAVTLAFAQTDLYDVHIAKEKNKTNIIIAVIIGVTIGGSIIFASYNKKKKQWNSQT